MKKTIILILIMSIMTILLTNDINKTTAKESPLHINPILIYETMVFSGEEDLIIEYEFQIGDMIIFELYPQVDVSGYLFSFIYTNDKLIKYEYAQFFREIDQNPTWCEFTVKVDENSITFGNSYFNITRSSGFWYEHEHDINDNFIPVYPYKIPTYLRKVIIYREIQTMKE